MTDQKKITKKTGRKRWVCPLCADGQLAPSRPRKNNALRYCLPCTAKTGKLVERDCPSAAKRKEKKAALKKASALRKREKAGPKQRRTKRSWMKDPKYLFQYKGGDINLMVAAERMAKAKNKWQKAADFAVEKTQARHPRRVTKDVKPCLAYLWKNTMAHRGYAERRGVTISYSRRGSGGSGLGGTTCGVHIAGTDINPGRLLMILLHEMCHFVHLTHWTCNNRPHDLFYNHLMCNMAKRLWGYDKWPYDAGWSEGKGYAPSRDLERWLEAQYKERNPRVMKWFTPKSEG